VSGSPSDGLALPAEPYLQGTAPHRPRWFGDLGIVAIAVAIIAVIAGTLSWCDFSLVTYKVSAPVPLVLCPGGTSAGEVPAGSTIRFSAVYSGSFGEFRELSTTDGDAVTGWAEADTVDEAAGVDSQDIFGLPVVADPAFDGPDCTSTVPTTTTTTTSTTTTVPATTAIATTVATTAPTTGPRTTVRRPRPTVAPTAATTAPTTTTTLPSTTTTTRDTEGPDVGTVTLIPPRIREQAPAGGSCASNLPTISQLSVAVADPSGVQDVTYEASVKNETEGGSLSNVDEVYSGTVGPFVGVFGPNDNDLVAVITVVITATDSAGNVTRGVATGTLVRCVPPPPPTTTTTFVIP
jgi:hypothetical protein